MRRVRRTKLCAFFLLVGPLALSQGLQIPRPRRCRIGVLDQEDLSAVFGFPPCSWADFDPSLNVSSHQHYGDYMVPSYFRKDGVPWQEAEYVVLDTSCYSMKSVYLMTGSSHLVRLDAPQVDELAVFTEFTKALGSHPLLQHKHVIGVGTHPLRYPCPSPSNSSTFALIRGDPVSICDSASRYLEYPFHVVGRRSLLPLSERKYFMSMISACEFGLEHALGKQIRGFIYHYLQSIPDSIIRCSNFVNKSMPHDEYVDIIRRSLFCLVIPGDVTSSRRLVEVLHYGCIPVIIGPPFHYLPLPNEIPWDLVSFSFHITDFEPLTNRGFFDRLTFEVCGGPCPDDSSQPKGSQHITVPSVFHIEPSLRALSEQEIKVQLRRIGMYQHMIDPEFLEDVVEDFVCNEAQ